MTYHKNAAFIRSQRSNQCLRKEKKKNERKSTGDSCNFYSVLTCTVSKSKWFVGSSNSSKCGALKKKGGECFFKTSREIKKKRWTKIIKLTHMWSWLEQHATFDHQTMSTLASTADRLRMFGKIVWKMVNKYWRSTHKQLPKKPKQ